MKFATIGCDGCGRVLDVPEDKRYEVGSGSFNECQRLDETAKTAGWSILHRLALCPHCAPVVRAHAIKDFKSRPDRAIPTAHLRAALVVLRDSLVVARSVAIAHEAQLVVAGAVATGAIKWALCKLRSV